MREINEEKKNIDGRQEIIDDELNDMGMQPESDFDAYIERAINSRIKKIAAKTCIIITAIVILIFFCISPLMNLCFANAAKLNEGENSVLLKTMRAYYETVFPYYEVCGINVEKDGFGCYTLNMNVADHREKIYIGATDVIMEMKLGKLSVKSDPDGKATLMLGRFDENNIITEGELEQLYRDIEELPESAVIYASVSQKKAEDVDSVAEKAGDKIELQWIQVYEAESDFQAGVSLNITAAFGKRDMRGEMNGEEIKEVYTENLKILRENFDIWKNLGIYSNSSIYYTGDAGVIDGLISKAKDYDSIETKNFCISGSRDDILAYLAAQEAEWDNVQIDKVNYSSFG